MSEKPSRRKVTDMKKHVAALLKLLEKDRDKYWNIDPKLGRLLFEIIFDRSYKTVLEIGTSNGYSALWMASALAKNNGRLYTIESHFRERFHLATENFYKAGLQKNIIQILGHAPEVIPKIPRKFDLIFLDATKAEYPLYFNAVKNRLKKGGLLISDNIQSHAKELLPFRKLLARDHRFISTEVSVGGGSLFSFKKLS